MKRYVALLRGINVGGKNKVPMPALRTALEGLGLDDVVTYIQSGNVVFGSSKAVKAATLEATIERELGVACAVVVRTHTELKAAVAANPFPDADPKSVHIGFMATKPAAGALDGLDLDQFAPDAVVVHGTEVYYCLPNGMGRTKLPPFVDRRLKVPTTVRNWNTVTKLLELSAA